MKWNKYILQIYKENIDKFTTLYLFSSFHHHLKVTSSQENSQQIHFPKLLHFCTCPIFSKPTSAHTSIIEWTYAHPGNASVIDSLKSSFVPYLSGGTS